MRFFIQCAVATAGNGGDPKMEIHFHKRAWRTQKTRHYEVLYIYPGSKPHKIPETKMKEALRTKSHEQMMAVLRSA